MRDSVDVGSVYDCTVQSDHVHGRWWIAKKTRNFDSQWRSPKRISSSFWVKINPSKCSKGSQECSDMCFERLEIWQKWVKFSTLVGAFPSFKRNQFPIWHHQTTALDRRFGKYEVWLESNGWLFQKVENKGVKNHICLFLSGRKLAAPWRRITLWASTRESSTSY